MKKGPYQKGQNYLIRTVTHYYTGKLVGIYRNELVLDNAAWIADTGRFANALKRGNLNEIEPMPDGTVVGRGAVIDASIWPHKLPNEQK